MKKLSLVMAILGLQSAFASNAPKFVCQSTNDGTRVIVQALEQTPFARKSIININGKKYNAVRHQNLRMHSDTPIYVYCISENPIQSCSYADDKMKFVELIFSTHGTVTLLSVQDRSNGLNVDCADGRMIWK